MARATLKEIHKREIEPISKNKRKNVYTNGVDDNYPERIDLLINNSTTAKLSVNKMISFIVGKGFKDTTLNTKVLNKKKKLTGYDILVSCASSLAKQKAITAHVNYNGLFKQDSLDILPFKNCRKEKGDDIGNDGVWYYSDKWGNSGFSFNKKNTKSKWYYPFNDDEKVLIEQFKKDGVKFDADAEVNENTFRGQVAYLNLEPEYEYPLAFIDPAYNDADSEYHSSLNRNNTIKNGFTDKQILVTRRGTEENPNDIEGAVIDMIGSDGANITTYEVSESAEDLTKELHVVSMGTDVNAERYKYFDEINERKILQCFENLHPALVSNSESSLFGNSGEMLKQIKLNYSEDTQYIRTAITQFLTKIMPDYNWEIEPLVSQLITTVDNV